MLRAHGSDPWTASPRCLSAKLPMIANQMVSLLSEQDAAEFLSAWSGSKLIVGSLCSGTDVCVDAIRGLAEVGKFVVEHKLSCEISPANQRWILQQCSPPPAILYEGVLEFARIVEPNETLACQGLPRKTFQELENFTRSELQSLAGNAFSGNTALACSLAALVAFKDIE